MVGWNNWLQPFGNVRLSTFPRCPAPAATAEKPQPRRVHLQSAHCPVQRAATQRVETSRPPKCCAAAVGKNRLAIFLCVIPPLRFKPGRLNLRRRSPEWVPRSIPHSGLLHYDVLQHTQRYRPQKAGLKQPRVFGPMLPGGECQTTGRARFIFQQPFWPAC